MSEMEYRPNIAVNREWCLLRLLTQAEGRQMDTRDDRYLIEQMNASHVGDVEEGNVTMCQFSGCDLTSLTQNESGILRVIDTDGNAACTQ